MIAPSIRTLALLGGTVVLVSTMTWRPALSNGFANGILGNPATVKVYCGHGTIGRALNRFPLRPLVIVVNGICTEDVSISRDRVTLVAANPRIDGITGVTDGGAAVRVAGARSVVIDGLRLRSAPGVASSSVFVTGNGEVSVQNALIEESGYGIRANHGGFFHLRDSEIRDGREYGLLLSDAASARVENSTIDLDNSNRSRSAAIGAFRSVNIRLRGANQIRNSGDDKIPGNEDDGFSLDLFHDVEFRQDGGHTVFVGTMEFGNLTHASLRNPEIAGGIELYGGSRVDIRNATDGSDEITGGRPVKVSGNSHLELRSGVVAITGPIGVHEFSVLALARDASITAQGNVEMTDSKLQIGENSSMSVSGDFGAFDRVGIAAFGPYAILDVAGHMNANAFFDMNIGDDSTLRIGGQLQMSDFSLMYAGNHASIEADMDFGGSATKVNFFGDGVRYTGNMNFGSKGKMDFGSNNIINGFINCNGGEFFAVTPPVVESGGFVMCPSI